MTVIIAQRWRQQQQRHNEANETAKHEGGTSVHSNGGWCGSGDSKEEIHRMSLKQTRQLYYWCRQISQLLFMEVRNTSSFVFTRAISYIDIDT